MSETPEAAAPDPQILQNQQVGMALTHIATSAGKPADAVMALTYALAHTIGNYVNLDAPDAVEGIVADTLGEVDRMYRVIIAKRIELAAGKATQQ